MYILQCMWNWKGFRKGSSATRSKWGNQFKDKNHQWSVGAGLHTSWGPVTRGSSIHCGKCKRQSELLSPSFEEEDLLDTSEAGLGADHTDPVDWLEWGTNHTCFIQVHHLAEWGARGDETLKEMTNLFLHNHTSVPVRLNYLVLWRNNCLSFRQS